MILEPSVLDLMKKRRASGNYGVGWHSTGFGNQVLPQSQRQMWSARSEISLHEERLEMSPERGQEMAKSVTAELT
jgi:hypothetical protein